MGDMRNEYNILVGEEGNRLFRRSGPRWEVCNIKMDLKEVGYEDVDCIHLTKNRVLW
jgi:hypothetical protein